MSKILLIGFCSNKTEDFKWDKTWDRMTEEDNFIPGNSKNAGVVVVVVVVVVVMLIIMMIVLGIILQGGSNMTGTICV